MNRHSRGNGTKIIPDICYSTMETHYDTQVQKKDEIEQVIELIMDQQYNLKAGLKHFGGGGGVCIHLKDRAVT